MEPSNTAEKTFTTLIVGGGVEALSVLLDLLKQSKVHELLSRDGLGIIDKTNFFGPGSMENYVARSSKSSALSFLRLLLKSPESEEPDEKLCDLLKNGKLDESIAQVVLTFKNIASHPKIYELCMPMFRELLDTNVLARLLDEGLRSASLAQSGYFLKILGNSLLYHIKVVKNAQIFYPKKEVICLRLLTDGSILVTTKVMLDEVEIKKPMIGQDKGPTEKFQDFKTRRILLTTPGGLLQQNPNTAFPPEKTLEAENFLQESGYYKVHSNLSKQIKKKILVIGGNATAFACVQLLLRGHEYNEFHEEVLNRNGPFIMKRQKLFERERITSYDIPTMKGSTRISSRSPHRNSSPSSSKGSPMKNQRSPVRNQQDQVKEVIDDSVFLNSATYGSIKGNEFRLLAKCVKPLAFDEGDVVVLHKKDIKVYFENNKEANKMGYKFEAGDTNSKGEINANDGLKGDAKKLYFDILSKAEKRVKLIQTESPEELRDLVDDVNYIIDCQGFEQQLIPIKDINGAPLKIKKGPNGGYLLDNQGRLVSEKGVIKGIYAIGYCFEGEKGDKSRIIEPYSRVTKYNNFENTQKMLMKDNTIKNLIQDNKNFDPSEEHYEELSGGNKVTAFSSNDHKSEEKKDSQFDLEALSSASTGGDPNMYSTLRVFEKLNFDKKKSDNSRCKKHK